MRRFTNNNFASHLRRAVTGSVPTAARWFRTAWVATRSPLAFGLRLWVSVCLSLYVAFWLELDNPYWAGTTAALVCQPHLGASLRKGWYRMIGTIVGGIAILVLTACFPQDRIAFRRPGFVGRGVRPCRHNTAQFPRPGSATRRGYSSDYRGQRARGDRRRERRGFYVGGDPRYRDLHWHRVRRHRARGDRFRQRRSPAGHPDRIHRDRDQRSVRRRLGAGWIRTFADTAGTARANPTCHRTRSHHRRGNRRIWRIYVKIRRCYRRRWMVCSRRWRAGASLRFTLPSYRMTKLNNWRQSCRKPHRTS